MKYIKLFIVSNVMNVLSCGLLMADSSRAERAPSSQQRSEHKKMPVKSQKTSRDDAQEDREKSKPFWNGFTRGLGEGTGRVVGEVGAEVALRVFKLWIEDPASRPLILKSAIWSVKNIATGVLAARFDGSDMNRDKVIGFVVINFLGDFAMQPFRSTQPSFVETAATVAIGNGLVLSGLDLIGASKSIDGAQVFRSLATYFGARLIIEGADTLRKKLFSDRVQKKEKELRA